MESEGSGIAESFIDITDAVCTDVSQIIFNKEDILSGKMFTRKQLMDCIIKQNDEIHELVEVLQKAEKNVLHKKQKEMIRQVLKKFI